MDAINIIREAIKANAAVKFALGVAGVAATVALVAGLFSNLWIALIGTILMFGLMYILLVFSSIARKAPSKAIHIIAYVMAAFFSTLIMATTLMLFLSVFWGW